MIDMKTIFAALFCIYVNINIMSSSCAMAVHSLTGFDLLSSCSLTDGICVGYFQGVLDHQELFQYLKLPPAFCLPDEVTVSQTIKLFQKYAADHVDELHMPAYVVANKALASYFPCQKQLLY